MTTSSESSCPPQNTPAIVTSNNHSSRSTIAGQFIAVLLIWSFTPLAAVFTVHELHWAWGVFIRYSFAVPLAMICLYFFKLRLALNTQALKAYGAGALGLCVSMGFCYLGATQVNSATISMIYGTSPFISGLIAVFILKQDKFHWSQWSGLVLALLGLYFCLGISNHSRNTFNGILYEFTAVFFYVISAFAIRHINAKIHPFVLMTGSTLLSWIGFICLLPFYMNDMPQQLPSLHAIIALLYSSIFSSVFAMLFYYQLLGKIRTTTLMLMTVITPVLATLWGYLFNHEPLTHNLVWGLLLLCSGLSLYSRRTKN